MDEIFPFLENLNIIDNCCVTQHSQNAEKNISTEQMSREVPFDSDKDTSVSSYSEDELLCEISYAHTELYIVQFLIDIEYGYLALCNIYNQPTLTINAF